MIRIKEEKPKYERTSVLSEEDSKKAFKTGFAVLNSYREWERAMFRSTDGLFN